MRLGTSLFEPCGLNLTTCTNDDTLRREGKSLRYRREFGCVSLTSLKFTLEFFVYFWGCGQASAATAAFTQQTINRWSSPQGPATFLMFHYKHIQPACGAHSTTWKSYRSRYLTAEYYCGFSTNSSFIPFLIPVSHRLIYTDRVPWSAPPLMRGWRTAVKKCKICLENKSRLYLDRSPLQTPDRFQCKQAKAPLGCLQKLHCRQTINPPGPWILTSYGISRMATASQSSQHHYQHNICTPGS